ncbi:hypothetical protein JZX86_28460 [Agrobacterium rosae]|uniref:hypothetical protein n=1 Tax=Agrobacterium rosae TaxID=1972867 RepID=UPI0019D39802|nr:hypothetical protein [Agrobacterium rosae]MBN7809255.1 hypothetical protein [Agrobacterium rosae]
MIRYADVDLAALEALVDAEVPAWRAQAAARTEQLKALGWYEDGAPSWSDIKPIYMRLQANKCIFCERPLGGEVAGKIEQDVEHFRPKNEVKLWPKKKRKKDPDRYTFSTGPTGAGYYWLAYDLQNYAAACKPCNSTRKSNAFPIAASARGVGGDDVATLNQSEQPLLVFPLGTIDDDPENLIEFRGILAFPKHEDGLAHKRALITIDFFGLNVREELWEDRFRVIRSLWHAYQTLQLSNDFDQKAAATRSIERDTADSGPQASCARSFLKLIHTNLERAWETYLLAEEFHKTSQPKKARQKRGE